MENIGDSTTHYQVINCLRELFTKTDIGSRAGPLTRKLVEIARKEIESNDPQRRLKSLDGFSVFSKNISSVEYNMFILLYLADSNQEVIQLLNL